LPLRKGARQRNKPPINKQQNPNSKAERLMGYTVVLWNWRTIYKL
jgi:hypothetical protein